MSNIISGLSAKQTALKLTEQFENWEFIPVPKGEKKPKLWDWPNKGTSSIDDIQKFPDDTSIGVLTGEKSGILVIDLDGKEGIEAFYELASENEAEVPDTFTVKTPGGGFHHYYLYPGDKGIKNSASKLAPKVDVRTDGGMVIAPGSIHPNGGQYQIQNDIPPVELPAWLLEELIKSSKNGGNPAGISSSISVGVGLPDLPSEALPEPFRLICEQTAISYQVPISIPISIVLGLGGALICQRVVVQLRKDFKEPTNLYSLVIAASSVRKSPVFKFLLVPLGKLEASSRAKRKEENSEISAQRATIKAQLNALKKDAAGATVQDLAKAQTRIKSLELQMPDFLGDFEFSCTDITPEKIPPAMEDNGEKLAVLSSEARWLEIIAGCFSKDGGANLDVALKGYSGDRIAVLRVGREAVHLEEPLLAVCQMFQIDFLKELLGHKSFSARGLVARFTPLIWEGSKKVRDINPLDVDEETFRCYEDVISKLYHLGVTNVDEEKILLSLTPESKEEFDVFRLEVEERIVEEQNFYFEAWLGKSVGNAMRIMGILHMLENPDGTVREISVETVRNAIKFAEVFRVQAEELHARVCSTGVHIVVNRILRILKQEGKALSKSAVKKKLSKGQVNNFESALELLQGADKVIVFEEKGKKGEKLELVNS